MNQSAPRGHRTTHRLPLLVALLAAISIVVLGPAASATAAPPKPAPTAQRAAATTACPYKYLCLYEGTNYTGTMHKLYNCETYYTAYPIHSVKNNQTPGTRVSFRDYNNVQFWVSPGAYWASPNSDGIAGSLNRAWYVKPC